MAFPTVAAAGSVAASTTQTFSTIMDAIPVEGGDIIFASVILPTTSAISTFFNDPEIETVLTDTSGSNIVILVRKLVTENVTYSLGALFSAPTIPVCAYYVIRGATNHQVESLIHSTGSTAIVNFPSISLGATHDCLIIAHDNNRFNYLPSSLPPGYTTITEVYGVGGQTRGGTIVLSREKITAQETPGNVTLPGVQNNFKTFTIAFWNEGGTSPEPPTTKTSFNAFIIT